MSRQRKSVIVAIQATFQDRGNDIEDRGRKTVRGHRAGTWNQGSGSLLTRRAGVGDRGPDSRGSGTRDQGSAPWLGPVQWWDPDQGWDRDRCRWGRIGARVRGLGTCAGAGGRVRRHGAGVRGPMPVPMSESSAGGAVRHTRPALECRVG